MCILNLKKGVVLILYYHFEIIFLQPRIISGYFSAKKKNDNIALILTQFVGIS